MKFSVVVSTTAPLLTDADINQKMMTWGKMMFEKKLLTTKKRNQVNHLLRREEGAAD